MVGLRRAVVKRLGAALAAGAAAALAISGCGTAASTSRATLRVPERSALAKVKGEVDISFWHSMDGVDEAALNTLIDKFNRQHAGKIKVEPEYAGGYSDAMGMFKGAIESRSTPNVMQAYDIGTQFMIDSKQAVPVQAFLDRDHYPTGDLQPAVAGYYSVGGKLYSMPFNISTPVLYYNKTIFQKAGLDPNTPPRTLAEVRADAQKIVASHAAPTGLEAAADGWYLEQWIATASATLCDQDNGRAGTPTTVRYDQPAAVAALDWWAGMVRDKLAAAGGAEDPDSDTKTDEAREAAVAAFTAQRAGMVLESSGQLNELGRAAQGGGYELGVAGYPRQDTDAAGGGPVVGGASLWIDSAGKKPAEVEASWQFVKYLASADSQAYWYTHTGYLPVSGRALDRPAGIAWRQQNPQFQVAADQVAATPVTAATRGCLVGVLPQARGRAEDAIKKALAGKADAASALDEAAKAVKPVIRNYNQTAR
jgi:sn-glycerol 3-phosphate transport system substrate-binding protein